MDAVSDWGSVSEWLAALGMPTEKVTDVTVRMVCAGPDRAVRWQLRVTRQVTDEEGQRVYGTATSLEPDVEVRTVLLPHGTQLP